MMCTDNVKGLQNISFKDDAKYFARVKVKVKFD